MIYKFLRGSIRPSPAYPFAAIYRPEIPVWVGDGDGRRLPFVGLLDTGADDVKIPLSQAGRLGVALDRENPIIFRGVGGEAVGFFGKVTLELRQSPRSYIWTAMAAFVSDPSDATPEERATISLGHTGFFRYFHANFDFLRGRVEIRPNGLFVGLPR